MSEESKTPGWNHVGPEHPQTKAALSATTPAELRDFVGVRMPAERPTPEVDKAIKYGVFLPENTHSAIEVAKWLERNLAEARNTIAEMETRHAAVMLHTQSIVDNANEAHQKMASAERPTPITDAMSNGFDYRGLPCLEKAVDCCRDLERQLAEANEQLEQERMRLAACGVIAMSDTPESAEKARDMHQDYHSASADDVARRVDECINLRQQLAEMTRQRNMLANSITNAAGVLSSVCRDSALPSSDQS